MMSSGFGSSFGSPADALTDEVFATLEGISALAGFGSPFSPIDAQVDVLDHLGAQAPIDELGAFHDEGGQVVTLSGEFFGEYEVRVGTQQMFDEGRYVVAYSGLSGAGQRCLSYMQNRRLSFVTPMGLPLGEIKVVALALQSMATPRTASIQIRKRTHQSRLYSLSSLFPPSYATHVAQTVRDEHLYD